MATLHFDGDTQRVYAVPDDSSYTVDGDGYRIYTPNNLATAEPLISFTAVEAWSAWVDYHDANKWALLCFDRSGGEYRETTDVGDVNSVTELRFLNDWHYVPANYRHISQLDGNFLPNPSTGNHFDTDRITATPPPEVKVLFADRGQFTTLDQVDGGSGGGGGVGVTVGGVVTAMAASLTGLADVKADGQAQALLAAELTGTALARVGSSTSGPTTTLWADFGNGVTGATAA